MARRVFLPLALTLFVAPLVQLAPAPAHATTVVPITAEALARRADAVVIATPRASQSRWEGGFIVTDLELEVQSVMRGALVRGERVVLGLPGGVVGRISQRVEGVPSPQIGIPYVFFLVRARDGGAGYNLAHPSAGVLPLTTASDGTVVVLPAREGMIVAPAAGTTGPMSAPTVMAREGIRLEALAGALRGMR